MMNIDLKEILMQEEEQALRIEESIFGLGRGFRFSGPGELVGEIETEKKMAEINEVFEDSELLLSIINEQATSKRMWQIVFACLTLVLMVAGFVCYNLYVGSEGQMVKLVNAEASIQTAGVGLAEAEGKVRTLESELAVSKAEFARVKNELAGSQAEVKAFVMKLTESNTKVESLETQVADMSGRLKELQGRNEEVVKKMKERLGQL